MKELNQEDLVLYYYGESDRSDEIASRLESSPAFRAELEELRAVLDAIEEPEIPELSPAFGATTWARLRPELEIKRRGWLSYPTRWAWAGAMSVAVIVAFLGGRHWPLQDASTLADIDRERILLVSVADHLERSQMLLQEVVNTENGDANFEPEQDRAAALVSLNRLYRQTAARSDRSDMVDTLEELERFLVELSHSAHASDLGAMRSRLEQKDLLFRLRILKSNLRDSAETRPTPLSESLNI